VVAELLLQGTAGEDAAAADAVEAVLLIAAAGDVVRKDPSRSHVEVITSEERYDGEALHGHAEVAADHRGQAVGLALEAECRALELLVVLELDLEQADHLDGEAGGAGDADA